MATSTAAPQRLTRKGQATRDRIVAAAAQLTFRGGVAGTSVEDVKAAAGVSSSQLYHYFKDKDELIRAVVAHQADAVLEAQQPLLGRLDSMKALRRWRDQSVALTRQLECTGGCPLGSLAGELAEISPRARVDIAAGFARWEDALRAGLRTMHERGELRAEADPDALALALLGALQGGLMLCQVRRDLTPLEVTVDAMLDHIESLTT